MEEFKRGDIVQLIPSKAKETQYILCLMTVDEVSEDGKKVVGYFNFPYKKIMRYEAEPEELIKIGRTQWVLKNKEEREENGLS